MDKHNIYHEWLGIVYERNIFEWDYLGRYLVCMIIQAIIFFGFNLALHYPFFPKLMARYQVNTCFQRIL